MSLRAPPRSMGLHESPLRDAASHAGLILRPVSPRSKPPLPRQRKVAQDDVTTQGTGSVEASLFGHAAVDTWRHSGALDSRYTSYRLRAAFPLGRADERPQP